LVSGEEIFEWDELQKNAKYSDGYMAASRAVRWFWDIFKYMSTGKKKKFLQFTTGSDRAPLGGLSHVPITIQRIADPTKLPISRTCFAIFGLPDYPSREEMAAKIDIALNETTGFGLR
jgi:ubiquitin-protein ligase E3 A